MQVRRFFILSLNVAAIALLLMAITAKTPTTAQVQDQTFRLINIERRLDQLQSRIDFIERAQQSQSLSSANTSNISTQAVLDLQRQQLALAEQMVMVQRRLLEMQKTLDRLAERSGAPAQPAPEKKERPDTKSKTPSGKP